MDSLPFGPSTNNYSDLESHLAEVIDLQAVGKFYRETEDETLDGDKAQDL